VRAHAFLYSARTRRGRARSAARLFVSALSGTARLQALAWCVMAIGAGIGFSLVVLDPAALYALMPASLGYNVDQIDSLYRSAQARDLFLAREPTAAAQNLLFGSYLFANNTRVGILAFASGILFGLPTVLLQLYNGIMIGTISAIFLRGGHAIDYLAWLLPHGVPELTAITLCCTAGFVLGRAVVAPDRSTRGEALRRAGPTALALFLTSVPLFFMAAWIESFVRESALGRAPRLAIAAGGLLALIAASLVLRRARQAEPEKVDWLDALLTDRARDPKPQTTPP
jgi:uncharacterized membrane protein SpoIIM required for sporulation